MSSTSLMTTRTAQSTSKSSFARSPSLHAVVSRKSSNVCLSIPCYRYARSRSSRQRATLYCDSTFRRLSTCIYAVHSEPPCCARVTYTGAFQLYDINGDGRISYDEMLQIVTAIYKMTGQMVKLPQDEDTPEKVHSPLSSYATLSLIYYAYISECKRSSRIWTATWTPISRTMNSSRAANRIRRLFRFATIIILSPISNSTLTLLYSTLGPLII